MTLQEFLAILKECPLIASVQASPGSPLDDTETLLKLAQASVSQGVRILRLEGVENIKRIRAATGCPTIGLIKRKYPDSELYITPTMREVEELIETGCEVIAIDARREPWFGTGEKTEKRPNGERLSDLIAKCHDAGRLVLADCTGSSIDIEVAQAAGCDLGSTTFNTIRLGEETFEKPCFHDFRWHIKVARVPVLAEGGYLTETQVRSALRIGAAGVVIGGAINDPVKQTKRFIRAVSVPLGNVGAVDIGGTWIRFALFDSDWKLLAKRRTPVHGTRKARLDWICKQAHKFGVTTVGISTGGVYDPVFGAMQDTKETIPDNFETEFAAEGLTFRPLNDGLATAWGHNLWLERHPTFGYWPGETSATLAIGTGVGCGVVDRFTFSTGYDYPRINDSAFEDGKTIEEVLGGRSLTTEPTEAQRSQAHRALLRSLEILGAVAQPEWVVLSGAVIESDWMLAKLGKPRKGQLVKLAKDVEQTHKRFRCSWIVRSPFGPDAGLYGAAALALFPPVGVFPE